MLLVRRGRLVLQVQKGRPDLLVQKARLVVLARKVRQAAQEVLATRYDRISFNEAISKNLRVMDATAFALCRDQNLPINVFSIFKPGAHRRVVHGQGEGTLVYC